LAEVHRLPEQRRQYIADGDRSALRATWHREAGYVVISMWHGDTCVATSHLTPRETGRLAGFITSGLAELAHEGMTPADTVTGMPSRQSWPKRLRGGARAWLDSIGWSLERIGKRLRSSSR
jgi:hypothetical protein